MGKNIDIRKFSFEKWVLPKTSQVLSFKEDIAVGYFDFFKVAPVMADETENPLEAYARQLDIENMNEETTCQQILAFTNLSEKKEEKIFISEPEKKEEIFTSYTKEKLDEFWGTFSGITFVSMLHVKDDAILKNVVNEVNTIFNKPKSKEPYHVVCYLSLDYSDLIICVKNMTPQEYLHRICEISYDNQEGKLIRDAFSVISIDYKIIEFIYEEIEKNPSWLYNNAKEEIILSLSQNYNIEMFESQFFTEFNFSVQNYKVYNKFLQELENHQVPLKISRLFGRHDFSIYMKNADLFWVLYVQYYIDKYSSKGPEGTRDEILFNCESLIKILGHNEAYKDEKLQNEEESCGENKEVIDIYEEAKEILTFLVDEYSKSRIHSENENICLRPIKVMKNSILGLLKNEFAKEFVLCFFEAFCMFLKYITKKLKVEEEKEGKDTQEFYQCFNEYFDNLNSLINSAMHNERQFIQSPSFNAVFYDVPAKLLAYYTALASHIMTIVQTENDKSHSLIFRPSFWRDVSVVPYSFNELPPVDRLLSVYINEKDLYRPRLVIRVICHEVAHYVGENNRERFVRKEAWLKSMLYLIIRVFIYNNLRIDLDKIVDKDTELYSAIKKVMEDVIEKQDFYKETDGYTVEFQNLILKVMDVVIENQDAKVIMIEMLSEYQKNKNASEFLAESDFRELRLYLKRVKTYFGIQSSTDTIKMKKFILDSRDKLEYIFSESYADLQMVLLLGLGLTEYVSTFFDKNQSADGIRNKNARAYYRIFNIVFLFYQLGIWNVYKIETDNDEIYKFVRYLQMDIQNLEIGRDGYSNIKVDSFIMQREQVQNFCEKTYQEDDKEDLVMLDRYWNANIQKYLIKVMESSCAWYSEKKEQIEYLRSKYKIINDFNDAIEVHDCIQAVNTDYAKKLYNFEYWKEQ